MKGRKPKIPSLVALEGNRGKRKPRNAPSVGGDFEPTFELVGVARAEWDRIRSEAKWIQAPSAMVLTLHCHAFGMWAEAVADIRERGNLIETRNGAVKNPSLQIERECKAFMIRSGIELGLTTCSQQKVSAPSAPTIDPIESALCG